MATAQAERPAPSASWDEHYRDERDAAGADWERFDVTAPEGQAAHATLLEMMRTGRITPSIGRELNFSEIPAALEEMEQREAAD